MDVTGFSPMNEETTDRKLNNIDSIPSLSQLRLLLDEERAAENKPAETDYPVLFASDRFPSGIPSASQLRFLQAQEKKAQEKKAQEKKTQETEEQFRVVRSVSRDTFDSEENDDEPITAIPEEKEIRMAPSKAEPKKTAVVKRAVPARKEQSRTAVRLVPKALRKKNHAKQDAGKAIKDEPIQTFAPVEKQETESPEEKMSASLASMKKIIGELAAAKKALNAPGEQPAESNKITQEYAEPETDFFPDFEAEEFVPEVKEEQAEKKNSFFFDKSEEYIVVPTKRIEDTDADADEKTEEKLNVSAEEESKKTLNKKESRRERKKKRRKRREAASIEKFTGSVLDNLPTAQQIEKSKPRHGHSSGVEQDEKPSEKQLIHERRRLNYRGDFFRVIRNTIFTLITVSAVAVLIAVLLLPVLRIYGASMTPSLNESEIVVSVKDGQFKTGDIIAFYYNNKILVKRVIAQAGDWVNIDKDGTVSINGEIIDEPYVQEKALGECDIEMPYQVPEDRVFVMGDYRDVSIDSRSTTVGPVAKDQIVGRIVYRIWPVQTFGKVD